MRYNIIYNDINLIHIDILSHLTRNHVEHVKICNVNKNRNPINIVTQVIWYVLRKRICCCEGVQVIIVTRGEILILVAAQRWERMIGMILQKTTFFTRVLHKIESWRIVNGMKKKYEKRRGRPTRWLLRPMIFARLCVFFSTQQTSKPSYLAGQLNFCLDIFKDKWIFGGCGFPVALWVYYWKNRWWNIEWKWIKLGTFVWTHSYYKTYQISDFTNDT